MLLMITIAFVYVPLIIVILGGLALFVIEKLDEQLAFMLSFIYYFCVFISTIFYIGVLIHWMWDNISISF